MAADGYAQATGKVGVCMATSGPGAINLLTGLMHSLMDSGSDCRPDRTGSDYDDRQRRLFRKPTFTV